MPEYHLDQSVSWINILALYAVTIRQDAARCRKIYAELLKGLVSLEEMRFYRDKIRKDYETLCELNAFLGRENSDTIERLVKPWLEP